MRAVDIIRLKRDGGTLGADQIAWMVAGIASGEVTDYQWSALLMAIVWRGMSAEETSALTDAMMRSGTVVDLSMIPGKKVDKHSTGGVGDKTSLILAPIAAAAGVLVPMVSGRGLGHTGGTLDKLESIPGFRVDLDLDRYKQVLEDCGFVMIGQTAEIAPADRFLYALRDATATVEAIPLLASSIMSKKLAEGIDGLVLDVKTGLGAFLPGLDDARALAETMSAIGRGLGKDLRVLISRMDQPLGLAVGNAVEVAECISCLKGEGPADLLNLSVELAAEMVVMAGRAKTLVEARDLCLSTIHDGSALERFRRLIEAQGGDPRVIDDLSLLPKAGREIPITARRSGVVHALNAREIGQATMKLGAGRTRVGAAIDLAVGVLLHKKLGDPVREGESLCTVFDNWHGSAEALESIRNAYIIDDGPVTLTDLIVERL